jgi:hypothetical protein
LQEFDSNLVKKQNSNTAECHMAYLEKFFKKKLLVEKLIFSLANQRLPTMIGIAEIVGIVVLPQSVKLCKTTIPGPFAQKLVKVLTFDKTGACRISSRPVHTRNSVGRCTWRFFLALTCRLDSTIMDFTGRVRG